jgi:hypothetical protein
MTDKALGTRGMCADKGSVVRQSFTGVLLWGLLQSVGIVVNPNIKNDILYKTINVTGSDGYESVFTAGESPPNFGGTKSWSHIWWMDSYLERKDRRELLYRATRWVAASSR